MRIRDLLLLLGRRGDEPRHARTFSSREPGFTALETDFFARASELYEEVNETVDLEEAA
jgi:hypothetical protein